MNYTTIAPPREIAERAAAQAESAAESAADAYAYDPYADPDPHAADPDPHAADPDPHAADRCRPNHDDCQTYRSAANYTYLLKLGADLAHLHDSDQAQGHPEKAAQILAWLHRAYGEKDYPIARHLARHHADQLPPPRGFDPEKTLSW